MISEKSEIDKSQIRFVNREAQSDLKSGEPLTPREHHELIGKISPCNKAAPEGFRINFLGIVTRKSFYGPNLLALSFGASDSDTGDKLPPFDEEYFEWMDLFEAVSEARRDFTMIELGAGYGKWLVRGEFTARLYGDLPCRLIGVEAEPTHFQWMKQHFIDNKIDLAGNDLIQAAVSDKNGFVKFKVGDAENCYGQSIVSGRDRLKQVVRFSRIANTSNSVARLIGENDTSFKETRLKAINLESLLAPLSKVDLIDLDVQGYEFRVLNAASKELDKKVKKVHVGTHSRKLESDLRSLFSGMGWTKKFDFPISSEVDTEWGLIKFHDGVQTWVNPSLKDF